MPYRIVWFICRALFGLYIPRTVRGVEHIPRSGPAIIAVNHLSNLDPPLVGTSFWRPAYFLAKAELFKHPLIAPLLLSIKAFPVRRGAPDRSAMKKCLSLLERGEMVVIFPEGTRSEDGSLQPPEAGIGMIINRSGAPVIPGFITGSDEAMPRGGGLRRTPVSITYGPPLDLAPPPGRRPDHAETAAAVMRAP